MNYFLTYGKNTLAPSMFSMVSNFFSRYSNGNRRSAGIKISHWNKGPGYLQTKMSEIKNLISSQHPHIIGLSEANLESSHDQNLVQLPGYNLHTCPTLNNPEISTRRVVSSS